MVSSSVANQVSSSPKAEEKVVYIDEEKQRSRGETEIYPGILDAADMTGIETVATEGGPTMEPDHDTIKMFVGQIPRQWNEPECRKLFEKYGPVYSLNILRDKSTQQSKGCCFVTYYHRKDAIEAQCAMHNVETIEGMHHPIQMKPADTENRNERKLFIGQLAKKQNEDDVRAMFSRFGHIEDCSVLRDSEGRSRGCAFVTFATRTCAVNATKEMHHSQTMEGCTAPLVVKFADGQSKDTAKSGGRPAMTSVSPVLSGQAALLQQLGGHAAAGVNIQTLTALATLLQGGGQQQNVLGLLGNAAALMPQAHSIDHLAQLQQAQLAAQQQQILALAGIGTQPQGGQQDHGNGLSAYAYQNNGSHQPVFQNVGVVPRQKQISPILGQVDPLQQAIHQYALSAINPSMAAQSAAATAAVGNGDVKGPDGSNLFIYHLPQDFGDSDLLTTFSPFGTVLSAKVFIDKVTNLSKCFGFVSYDNAQSAQNAIAAMNGFQIGSKRLKVQLKNERSAPYAKVN